MSRRSGSCGAIAGESRPRPSRNRSRGKRELVRIEDFLDLASIAPMPFSPSGGGSFAKLVPSGSFAKLVPVSPVMQAKADASSGAGGDAGPETPSTLAGSPEVSPLPMSPAGSLRNRSAPDLRPPSPGGRSPSRTMAGNHTSFQGERDSAVSDGASSDDDRLQDDPSRSFMDIPSRSFSRSWAKRSTLTKMLFQVAPQQGPGSSNHVVYGDLQPIDGNGEVHGFLEEEKEDRDVRRRSMPGSKQGSLMVTMPQSSIIGEGQYGLVWRARSELTGKWYAVKNVKVRVASDELNTRELDIARRICKDPHPCMVRCFQVHTFDDGTLSAMVMEFCRRGDLQGRIRRGRDTAASSGHFYKPPSRSLKWVGQVFLGVEYMHFKMNLLFRDLKPGNVVLTSDGRAKITDFGLSRVGLESEGAWTFGFPAGSPGYTAPEVMEQEEYDQAADMYSLGVLIFVLLTGGVADREEPSPPVNQIDEDWELMERSLADPSTYAAELLGEHPCDLIKKLIKREPAERPTHDDIRSHPLLEHLWFPERAADAEAVKVWLQGLAEEE